MVRFRKSVAISILAWALTGSLGVAQESGSNTTSVAAPAPEKTKAKPTKAADPQALPDAKHHKGTPPATASATKPASSDAQAKTKNDAAAATPASNQLAGAVAQGGGSTSAVPKAAKPTPAQASAKAGPTCAIEEAEQPRGGRLDLIGNGFGQAPVVRIEGKPARMIERREDRLVVQVPVDSNGGAVTVQAQGQNQTCGSLVIIGKNR